MCTLHLPSAGEAHAGTELWEGRKKWKPNSDARSKPTNYQQALREEGSTTEVEFEQMGAALLQPGAGEAACDSRVLDGSLQQNLGC